MPDVRGLRPGPLTALLALLALLGACAPFRDGLPPAEPGPALSVPQEAGLRIVYLIHGDANYTYHDSAGRRLRADQEALLQAVDVGTRAEHAEVLIFHRRTGMARWLWSTPGGTFHHYRFGTRVHRETYSRSEDDFEAETRLLRRHVSQSEDAGDVPLVVAYFGHEIPPHPESEDGLGGLTVARFAQGIEGLSSRAHRPAGNGAWDDGNPKPYGLVILSTCYGGTPDMLTELSPLADFVVASPAYLHLSFLDTRALAVFAPEKQAASTRKSMRALADSVAQQSFRRLSDRTQTEVTVAVYDTREAAPYLRAETGDTRKKTGGGVWHDCAEDPLFDSVLAASGVTLHYRAPRFGPGKHIPSRSAWQCAF